MAEETHERREKKVEQKGLKRLRAGMTGPRPEHHCDNCGCDRYSLCGCPKAAKKAE